MEKKNIFSRIGFGLVAIIVCGQISSMILLKVAPNLFKGTIGGIISAYVGMYLIGLPIFIWLTKRVPKESIEKKQPVSVIQIFKMYILVLFGMYVVNILFGLIMQFFTKQNSNLMGEAFSDMPIIGMTLLVVIFAPIIEELIFRRLLYQLLAPSGIKTYLFTSALIFGLFHMNLSQSVYTFWFGLFLAYLFYKTGSVLYPIILHMMVNFTGSIMPLFSAKNLILAIAMGLWVIVVIIIGIILSISLRKKIKTSSPDGIFKQKIPFKTIFLNPGMTLYVLLCTIFILYVLINQVIG